MRQSALALEGPPEKRFRGRDIPLGAEQEIDSLSFFVDRAVKISPAPLNLHVGFIDSPGGASSACEAVPAPFEVRDVALDPAHDRRIDQGHSALGHHFHEITKAELVPEYQRTQRMMISRSKWRPLKRLSMHGISVRFFQSRVHAKYASHPQFAPEPLQPMFLPGTADADLIEMTFVHRAEAPTAGSDSRISGQFRPPSECLIRHRDTAGGQSLTRRRLFASVVL